MSESFPSQEDNPWGLNNYDLAMRFFTDPSVGPIVMDRLLVKLGVQDETQRKEILDTPLPSQDMACRDYLSGLAQQHGSADVIATLVAAEPDTPGYEDGLEMARHSLQAYTGITLAPQEG